jgi:hypothetical protein
MDKRQKKEHEPINRSSKIKWSDIKTEIIGYPKDTNPCSFLLQEHSIIFIALSLAWIFCRFLFILKSISFYLYLVCLVFS